MRSNMLIRSAAFHLALTRSLEAVVAVEVLTFVSQAESQAVLEKRPELGSTFTSLSMEIMVQSWSTNQSLLLLNTLLGVTRVAYFQSVTC